MAASSPSADVSTPGGYSYSYAAPGAPAAGAIATHAGSAVAVSSSLPFSDSSVSLEAALYHLSSCPDFMAFFYRHISCCTPRGPFRYYAALTFVVRARQRYGPDGLGGEDGGAAVAVPRQQEATLQPPPPQPPVSGGPIDGLPHASALPSAPAVSGAEPSVDSTIAPPPRRQFASEHAAALYAAISVRSVLALMEQKFSTDHLENWPLFYVPCEIHSHEVEMMRQEQ